MVWVKDGQAAAEQMVARLRTASASGARVCSRCLYRDARGRQNGSARGLSSNKCSLRMAYVQVSFAHGIRRRRREAELYHVPGNNVEFHENLKF